MCDICCIVYTWRQIVLSDDFLVTLEHDVTRVVMTSHEYWAGAAGGDAWSARLSAAQLERDVWRDKTYKDAVWHHSDLEICITQREIYRMLIIVFIMRQMDLACVFM